jgi:hypothetical protein
MNFGKNQFSPVITLDLFFCIFYFENWGVNSGAFAKKVLNSKNHSFSPFSTGYFLDEILQTIS